MFWRDSLLDVRHSAQGFRGTDLVSEHRPDWATHRVLMVGDSVLYGLGSRDEDVFTELLKPDLPGTEIINAGVPGYGTRQEVAVIDLLGPVIKPDLIVVIFRWNDLEDNLRHDTPEFEFNNEGQVVRTDLMVPDGFDPLAMRKPLPLDMKGDEAFYKRLNLYRAGKNAVRAPRNRFLLPKHRRVLRGWARMLKNTALGVEHDRIDRPDDRARAWEVTRKLLATAKAKSDQAGAELLVVSVPAYSLVNRRRYGERPDELNVRVEGDLTVVCEELGISYVDLLPAMRLADQQSHEPLYFYDEKHLTAGGNVVVARLLKDILPNYLN